MLKENYGGELVMLPGDSNVGHWDRENFIKGFKPGLTPAESIRQAGELCYTGMVGAFNEAGYSTLLMAVGDHELGDNPWPLGSAKSKHQAEFREAFAKGFNIDPDTGQFIYDKPIGEAASRPLGTKYETTSFACQYKTSCSLRSTSSIRRIRMSRSADRAVSPARWSASTWRGWITSYRRLAK